MKNSTKMKHDFLGCYKVYSHFPRPNYYSGIHWWFYKLYSSKQSAKAAIKRLKIQRNDAVEKGLIFKIVYSPTPYNDDYDEVVYDESINEVVNNNEACC